MEDKLIKVGISQGDTNGIGYEVILKTFSDIRMFDLCIPVLYGSQKIADFYNKQLGSSDLPPAEIHVITDPHKAIKGKLNIINCVDIKMSVEAGQSTKSGGKASLQSLEALVNDAKKGLLDVVLTAPINKNNIQDTNFKFPGHTEYLEKHFGDSKNKSLMILLNESIRVALVTGHIPLSEVPAKVTTSAILEKIIIFNQSLKSDFGIDRPRIAVLSLNPHAGDKGLLGNEEQSVIEPSISEADKKGITVFGPYAADGFFGSQTYNKFDGILAMYHDQGLAPFNALAMEDGVNFTAGLSIVRTSPAHGTAYDIAGKNIASENSFRQALYTALDVYRNRINYKEAISNPLQKHYIDRSGDKEKIDLTQEE
jgi:4-hydroxythreonine-4-phosphate dehydrogenase